MSISLNVPIDSVLVFLAQMRGMHGDGMGAMMILWIVLGILLIILLVLLIVFLIRQIQK